ncbi:MAG: hypothetical protein IJ666_01405 [Ruminococcus sp.]|nr:hypothetical protein [Ruminococcus sp.]
MDKTMLDKINRFTRRDFSEDELYVFSVILCDNDIDRDGERFSDEALESLKSLFVGKTGIFDHDASSSNQNARIFDTEIISDTSRTTKYGSTYKYLKGTAYMVRTDDNKNLISEIDGGIKKEVSISCCADEKLCSVCGNEISLCAHARGKYYGGNLCHTVLNKISDAYEWSFVAVPAQVNAGVTKRFSDEGERICADFRETDSERELRRDIRRLAYFSGGRTAAAAAELSSKNLNAAQLAELKKSYERLCGHNGIRVQLMTENSENDSNNSYTLR